jgi:hypothetical protein
MILAKNAPAKNHPGEECSSKEYSSLTKKISSAKNYPAKNHPSEDFSGEE